jgi:hypothetical protein
MRKIWAEDPKKGPLIDRLFEDEIYQKEPTETELDEARKKRHSGF